MMALLNPQPSKKHNSYLSMLYFFYLKQKRKSVTTMPYKSAPSITVKHQRDCRLHTLGKAYSMLSDTVMAACHSHFFFQSRETAIHSRRFQDSMYTVIHVLFPLFPPPSLALLCCRLSPAHNSPFLLSWQVFMCKQTEGRRVTFVFLSLTCP